MAQRNQPRREVPCDECDLPAARVQGDNLILQNRHRGRKHLTVRSLRRLLAEAGPEGEATTTTT